jgi:hypothetical protein
LIDVVGLITLKPKKGLYVGTFFEEARLDQLSTPVRTNMPKTSTILGNDSKLGYGKPTNTCYANGKTMSNRTTIQSETSDLHLLETWPCILVAEVNAEIAQLGCKDGQCNEFTPVYVKLGLSPFLSLGSTIWNF